MFYNSGQWTIAFIDKGPPLTTHGRIFASARDTGEHGTGRACHIDTSCARTAAARGVRGYEVVTVIVHKQQAWPVVEILVSSRSSAPPSVRCGLELQTIHRFSQSRRRPLIGRSSGWLKLPTSAFTLKTLLLRHYAKQVPKHLNKQGK